VIHEVTFRSQAELAQRTVGGTFVSGARGVGHAASGPPPALRTRARLATGRRCCWADTNR